VFDGETHLETEILDIDGTHQGPGYVLADELGLDPSVVRAATPEEKAALGEVQAELIVVLGTDFDLDSVLSGSTAAGG
jgi:hypothetical protein